MRQQLRPPGYRQVESDSAVTDHCALVAGLLAGDTQAALLAYREFAPLVRRLLCRILAVPRDLDDLVQEVFLRVFRHVDSLENPRALPAFVITTTTRLAQSELRRRFVRRLVGWFPGGDPPEVPGLHPDPAAREALGRFYAILDRLSAPDRTAFVLRFVEEMELAEVASALGVSLATIKRRLARAWGDVERLVSEDEGLREYLSDLGRGVR